MTRDPSAVINRRRYSFAVIFTALGFVLLAKAVRMELSVATLFVGWFGVCVFILGIAFVFRYAGVFGKTASGSMRLVPRTIMFPFSCTTWVAWSLQNRVVREPIWNTVSPGLVVGRRCTESELPPNARAVVDLTAEFPTPRFIRESLSIVCVPTLDGCAPDWKDCVRVFDSLQPNDDSIVYVFCANGHGRSVMFVAAWLGWMGLAESPDEAIGMIKQARPLASPNADQRSFLDEVFRVIRTDAKRDG